MLTREEVAARILTLPPAEQARAAELALRLYGPAPRAPRPGSREALSWRSRIEARLPAPHGKQAAIEASPAKRKVICSGRRSGKTTLAARGGILRALDGRRCLLTSTSQDQADAFWEKAVEWLGEPIRAKAVKKNESRRILTFGLTGGRIKVKTAREPDELRGDYCDFFVGDEAARLKSRAWSEVVAPMLADTDGDAWLISTPNRINWFYDVFQRGLSDESGRWKSWHFTTLDNPHLSADAVAELVTDMTEEDYRQEILAEFLQGEGAVFTNLDAVCTEAPSTPAEHEGHRIVMGLDWAQAEDYTVPCLFCETCMREVWIERMRRKPWKEMRTRVGELHAAWRVARLVAESNSIGGPNIEALADEHKIDVERFETTSATKPKAVQSLKLAFERGEARWLADGTAKGEARAYESRVSAATGRVSYSAPEGMHDDTVVARMLALWAVCSPGPPVFKARIL